MNSPKSWGGEIPSECLGGCVGHGSSNTRTISELIMQFSSPISTKEIASTSISTSVHHRFISIKNHTSRINYKIASSELSSSLNCILSQAN